MTTETAYEGWALIEQMGFRKTYALVREVEMYGTKMLRLDVPIPGEPGKFTTRFAGGPSLYQVTPLDEALARDLAGRQADPRPVEPIGYRLRGPHHGEEHARSVAFQEAGDDDGDPAFADEDEDS
jgi:hypothetical protein